MIIRRDNMGHSPLTPEMMAAAVARGVYAPGPRSATPSPADHTTSPFSGTTSPFNPTISSFSPFHSTISHRPVSPEDNMTPVQGQGQPLYTLNPLQQRQAMQKEAYERERASLLKKAGNSQGDAVESLAAKYLAV